MKLFELPNSVPADIYQLFVDYKNSNELKEKFKSLIMQLIGYIKIKYCIEIIDVEVKVANIIEEDKISNCFNLIIFDIDGLSNDQLKEKLQKCITEDIEKINTLSKNIETNIKDKVNVLAISNPEVVNCSIDNKTFLLTTMDCQTVVDKFGWEIVGLNK